MNFNFFSLYPVERQKYNRIQAILDSISDVMSHAEKCDTKALSILVEKNETAISSMKRLRAEIAENHGIDPAKIITINENFLFYRI